MRKKLFNFLVINLFLIFFSSPVLSQSTQYSQNIADKLVKIATSEKSISKSDYDDFWNATGIKSREEKINLIAILKANYFLIQQYNNILWECAEKSWIDNKIVNCQTINANYLKIRNDIFKLLGDEEFKKIDDNFNNIIKISSKRGGSMMNGQAEQPITLEKVQFAKRASQNMLQRVDKILQVDFK
jgi:hypothetical protein